MTPNSISDNSRNIIAIHGGMGSGKTTLALRLQKEIAKNIPIKNKYKLFDIESFAQPLKAIVRHLGFPCPGGMAALPSKDQLSEVLGVTYGKALQDIGALMRRELCESIWVKNLDDRIDGSRRVIIDDLRMPNELDYVLDKRRSGSNVFLIKILPMDKNGITHNGGLGDGRDVNHESEQDLPTECFDADVFRWPDDGDVDFILDKMSRCGFFHELEKSEDMP